MVALCPRISVPSNKGEGEWAPPDDAGASVREFDRYLWGKKSLRLRSGPVFINDRSDNRKSGYPTSVPNDLTFCFKTLLPDFIEEARKRGLLVYLQVGATSVPTLLDQDKPRLPNGEMPTRRMANVACLASPRVEDHIGRYVRALLDSFPSITGLRIDWPELPCYTLGETFQDFSASTEQFAMRTGFNFTEIRAAAQRLWTKLHGGLSNGDLDRLATLPETGGPALTAWWPEDPLIASWLELKRALSRHVIGIWREAIDACRPDVELSANAFIPPFSDLTGFDYGSMAGLADAVSPKLYTMHWLQLARFWNNALTIANPGVDSRLLTQALARFWQLDPPPGDAGSDHFRYPEPWEPHAVSNRVMTRNLARAREQTPSSVALTPIVHGYGPLDDFSRRFRLACRPDVASVWVNRYGYLSDQKLDVIGSRQ